MLKRPDRYAALLRVRQREEDARAAALAKAVGAIRNAEARRVALVERHEDTLQRASEATAGTNVPLMEQFSQYERHVIQLIAHSDKDIQQLHGDRQKRQQEFEASHRRRKVVDRLVERIVSRWESHVEREERKAIEESVAMRYAFRRDEGRSL